MPPKRNISTNQAQARGIPYDLRRVNMPHEEPPPAPGEKAKQTYMPRKTSQAMAAIRNEAKSQAASKHRGQSMVGRKTSAPPPAHSTRSKQAASARRSATPLNLPPRARSRSVSRAAPASTAAAIQTSKRVRFSAEPPMASGAIQDLERSSNQDTSGSEDSEAEEEEEGAEEEEEDELALPAEPAHQPLNPRRRLQDLANIGSSDFETLQNNADEAGAIFYNARERYKDAQHTVRLVEARRKYMEMRHDGPVTSDAEEALEEAMISADFPLEVSLQLYANKKVVVRKVLGRATCQTFKADDFKSTVIQLFEHVCGPVGYTIIKCTATYKHSSGRGGTRAHDLDDISEAEAEELLDLVEATRNRYYTGHMVIAFAIHFEFDPAEAARAANTGAIAETSSPLPSSPPAAPAPVKKGRRSRTSYL